VRQEPGLDGRAFRFCRRAQRAHEIIVVAIIVVAIIVVLMLFMR
jgi:t-SNARE complex subunit (syntaxin)